MTSVAATPFLPVATTATVTAQSAIVSLHDVAPTTWDVCKEIVAELQHHGIRACSLLVVPNYHRSGSSLANQPFVSWLQHLEAAGHEIVIHGYFHERPRRANESLTERFVTQIYTQDEGEFFDLDYDESRRRITSAREEFEGVGLKPHGFVAPAWLLGSEAERAAGDAGMEYTTRLSSVRDLRTGDTFNARSLVYSARNGWRRSASLCWNGALAQVFQNAPLMRLSIHPLDRAYPAIWQQIIRLLKKMSVDRTLTTYRDWMVEWRIRRGPRV
jgi:predicted deacetylase